MQTSKYFETRDISGTHGPCVNRVSVSLVDNVTSSRSGWRYADWKTRLAKKQDASTQYARSFMRLTEIQWGLWRMPKPTSYSTVCNAYGGPSKPEYREWEGIAFASANVGPSTIWSDKQLALQYIASRNLRRNYAKWKPEVNLLVPIGEYRETIGLYNQVVNDTFAYVNKAYSLLRYANTPKKLARLLGRAGDAWLSYAFGIRPLLNDVASASQEIAANINGIPAFSARGIGEQEWVSVQSGRNYQVDANGLFKVDWVCRHEHSLRVKQTMGFKAVSSWADGFAAGSSLFEPNIREVVLGIYDLIPYTWLLDYFTTMNEWLEGMFDLTLEPYYRSESTLYTCTTMCTVSPSAGFDIQTLRPQIWTTEYASYSRTPQTVLYQRPGPQFKNIENVFGLKKLLNLTALLFSKRATRLSKESTDYIRRRRGYII